MKKLNCISLLFQTLLYLAVFSLSKAQIQDTTIYPDSVPSDDNNVCNSPECIQTASRVLTYMDTSLDPCDNFYKFACDNIIKDYRSNENKSVDQFSLIERGILPDIKFYLQNETIPTSPKYARLIKTFYRNCFDEFSKNTRNISSILELINKTSGWPFLEGDSWKDEHFQWEKFGFLTENITVFVNYFIQLDTIYYEDSLQRVIRIGKPEMFLHSGMFEKLRIIGRLFGVNTNYTNDSLHRISIVDDMLNGVSRGKMIGTQDFQRYSHKTMTVKELIQIYPNISWKEYFHTGLQPNNIDDNDKIEVLDLSYIRNLNNIITTISKKDQADYLMWRVIYNILEVYIKTTSTNNNPLDICYDFVVHTFENTFGLLYLQNNFNNDSFPKDVDEMIDNIHEQFVTILKNNSWLVNETKLKALEKLEYMTILRPAQQLFYDNMIDKYYKNFEITPGDYFESLINITKFAIDKIHNIVMESEGNIIYWPDILTAVIPQNELTENRVVLMPPIFQGVFFNKDRPQYMNYGAIGFVIGHEIAHSLDSIGKDYDKTGEKVNWWDAVSDKVFLSKIQCIINQHNNYKVEKVGLNVNGNLTNIEDTADIVGVKLAYSAYEKYMETYGSEPLLQGVNYTQRQLFWISFAQTQCAALTTEKIKEIIKTSRHSPHEFRVIGSLANSLEFARDFHCALNTTMNPNDKCHVW